MNKEMKAPRFDRLIWHAHHWTDRLNAVTYSKGVCKRINELYDLIEKINICGDNNLRNYYIEVDKGTLDEYIECYKDEEEEDTIDYKSYEKSWKLDYPQDSYFYLIEAVKVDEYRVINIKIEMLFMLI